MISRASSPLPWLGGLLALYLLGPIAAFMVRVTGGVSATPGLSSALLTSILTATIATAVIVTLGTPLAYLLARDRGPSTRILTVLIALPVALPPLMGGLLLLYLVGPYAPLGRLFDGQLTDTRAGIVLAQTFVAAPFLVIVARSAFVALDPALEEVAATLGHGRFARFLRVAVPAALPGIAAGALLAWLRSFGEFGATVILAYHPYSLPVLTFEQFDATGLPATMLPVAAALAAALVVLLAVNVPIPRRRSRPRRPRDRATSPIAGQIARRSAGPLDFALTKRLGSFSLHVEHRASTGRLALLGSSGAGKTVTLRLLAGLLASDGDAHVLAGSLPLHRLPPERREIGYVPQHSALLPRLSVWGQVTLGPKVRASVAARWLEQLGLLGLEDRYPQELSGGQQRRVAIARALAIEPRILLMDEPFTGLDAPVRDRLRRELRELQRESGLSTVIVTHDPEEAALLADEIIVLDRGRVVQAATREAVFARPNSPEVAKLLGIPNTHSARTAGPDRIDCDGLEIAAPTAGLAAGTLVMWCVRPERIRVRPDGRYPATVLDEVDLGYVQELTLGVGPSMRLVVRTAEKIELMRGDPVGVDLAPEDVMLWPLGRRAAQGSPQRAADPVGR